MAICVLRKRAAGALILLLCLGAGICDEDPQGDDVDNTLSKEGEPGPMKKFMPCYEEDHRFSPYISKDMWEEKKNLLYSHMPMDYVVIREGGKRCKSHGECLTSLASEMRKGAHAECRALDNFYIGGDGEVYEGRGWGSAPYWHLNGLRRSAVTATFLGSYESEGPSERAVRAFWRMAKSGVWKGNLSPGYHVISMGRVYNDTTMVGHALEKVFQDSSLGVKEFDMMATWELTPDKTLPLITREEWGAKKPTKLSSGTGFRIKYVMLNEGGERCFTQEECTSRVKAEQDLQRDVFGDLVDNFYIGEDGFVYEGRGFNLKSLWDTEIEVEESKYFKEESITVRLFGNFHSDLPSEKAVGALKLLVNAGVWLNKITDGYKLYSLRGIYNDSRFLGDRLFQAAKKWTHWDTQLEERIEKELEDGDGFIGMVKRGTWEAREGSKKLVNLDHPVDFVLIDEHSEYDRCLNSKQCAEIMKKIQDAELEGYGDLKHNFYVSDNGNVYEGRGWDVRPQFQAKYFNKSLITVNFLGNHQVNGASMTALAAFENLIRVGVRKGKIAPNYHLYSSRGVYDDADLLGDGLKNYFVEKENWFKNLDTMTEEERYDSGLLPIIPYNDWSDIEVNATHHSYANPVLYVVVGNIRDRCYDHDECLDIMKDIQNNDKAKEEGLWDNFYIGDDGMAYEGRGWRFAPSLYHEGIKTEFFRVTFLGQFRDESEPSNLSIRAFSRLMENGVKTRKLAPDFKIISIHQILESESQSSDRLYSTIKTWNRWTSEFNLVPDVDGMPSSHKMFISREDWHAKKSVHPHTNIKHPVSYVIVRRSGEDCSDYSSCVKNVQKMQENLSPRNWDVADNFYIGADGHIFEGRGWDHFSLFAAKGIQNNFISVGFLGSFESTPPTPKALLAFHILQQTGVALGKLVPNFKTISMGEIVGKEEVTETLIEALKSVDNWSQTFDLSFDAARLRSLSTSFVLIEEWNLSDLSVRKSSKMSHPLKYVAIRDGGKACETYETCLARITKEHKDRHDSSDGGVSENFYIGNDGSVFEGSGWDWDMAWGYSGWQKTVEVQFFGNYENELPSKKAIEAFNEIIIKIGIETGKLSSDYHIVPVPIDDSRRLGSKLKAEIMTWKNAVEEIS